MITMSSRKLSNIMSKDHDVKDTDSRIPIKVGDRPTFILKTREGESRAVSPSQRNSAKKEPDSQVAAPSKLSESRTLISISPEMTSSTKFMDENMQLCESPLDHLVEQPDFLVVGVLGTQGVGKSTILSLLTSNYAKDMFAVQNSSHHKNATNCTNGIDFYVTKNRVIYLDSQPIFSGSGITAATSMMEYFGNTGYNLEVQSLQFAAFLYSVCHVIIVVQDWFVNPNLIRFLQTAEMLKPSSTSNLDQDYVEYYPHILFLHNKSELSDFMPNTLTTMKDFYSKVFVSSKLQTHSGLDMSPCSTDGQLNLFLIPSINEQEEPGIRDNTTELIEKLRKKIHGVSRNPMTPATLTEKNWYHYASKVVDAMKKSHLSLEYGRLMP